MNNIDPKFKSFSSKQLREHIWNIPSDIIQQYFPWFSLSYFFPEEKQRALVYNAAFIQLFKHDTREFRQILVELVDKE